MSVLHYLCNYITFDKYRISFYDSSAPSTLTDTYAYVRLIVNENLFVKISATRSRWLWFKPTWDVTEIWMYPVDEKGRQKGEAITVGEEDIPEKVRAYLADAFHDLLVQQKAFHAEKLVERFEPVLPRLNLSHYVE